MTPFKIQKRQLLSEVTKQKRRERGRVLLKKLTAGMQENLETGEVVWTDEKLFTVEPNFNQKNDMALWYYYGFDIWVMEITNEWVTNCSSRVTIILIVITSGEATSDYNNIVVTSDE